MLCWDEANIACTCIDPDVNMMVYIHLFQGFLADPMVEQQLQKKMQSGEERVIAQLD